jgi:ribose 1,5-bisphosphokinase
MGWESGSEARLIYVMGASGSGKDTLMRYARQRLADTGTAFAHRYITREAGAGGENHVALSEVEFAARLARGMFAMHWESHGLRYAIGIEIDAWLAGGINVVVNGSRGYLEQARARYPRLVPVSIEVSTETLRKRLLARGRETPAAIEQRLARHAALHTEGLAGYRIDNDGTLEEAGEALVRLIREGHREVAPCA